MGSPTAPAAVLAQAFDGADTVFWLVPPDPRADSVEAAYVGFTQPAAAVLRQQAVRRIVGITALDGAPPRPNTAAS